MTDIERLRRFKVTLEDMETWARVEEALEPNFHESPGMRAPLRKLLKDEADAKRAKVSSARVPSVGVKVASTTRVPQHLEKIEGRQHDR